MINVIPIDILMASLITIAAFVIAVISLVFIRRRLEKIAGKTRTKIDDYACMMLRGPTTIFIIAFVAFLAISYWDTILPGILPEWLSSNLGTINMAIGVVVATSIVALIFNIFFGTHVKRAIVQGPETETTYRMITRIAVIIIYIVGFAIAATVLFPGAIGSLTTLLFGAGFLAIVIGMAAQRVIGNILSGINVSITRPIRIGDAVRIKEEFGFVEDIGLRHTVIRTWDNRRMMIPNSVLDDETIINYTAKDPKKLFGVTVNVPYDTDVEKVAEIMKSEAKKHPGVLPELDPIFQVLNFEEGAIGLRLLFMAKDQSTAFGAACDIRRSVKRRFDEEGIRISCPSRYIISSSSPTTEKSVDKVAVE
jgi:small conductance mechanosensitive channel